MEVERIRLYSCYFSPGESLDAFKLNLDCLEDNCKTAGKSFIIAGDFNSKSHAWGENRSDKRGALVSEMIVRLNLVILNEGNKYTYWGYNSNSR